MFPQFLELCFNVDKRKTTIHPTKILRKLVGEERNTLKQFLYSLFDVYNLYEENFVCQGMSSHFSQQRTQIVN